VRMEKEISRQENDITHRKIIALKEKMRKSKLKQKRIYENIQEHTKIYKNIQ